MSRQLSGVVREGRVSSFFQITRA